MKIATTSTGGYTNHHCLSLSHPSQYSMEAVEKGGGGGSLLQLCIYLSSYPGYCYKIESRMDCLWIDLWKCTLFIGKRDNTILPGREKNHLNMSSNGFQWIPSGVTNIPSLSTLVIFHNRIKNSCRGEQWGKGNLMEAWVAIYWSLGFVRQSHFWPGRSPPLPGRVLFSSPGSFYQKQQPMILYYWVMDATDPQYN